MRGKEERRKAIKCRQRIISMPQTAVLIIYNIIKERFQKRIVMNMGKYYYTIDNNTKTNKCPDISN